MLQLNTVFIDTTATEVYLDPYLSPANSSAINNGSQDYKSYYCRGFFIIWFVQKKVKDPTRAPIFGSAT